MKWFKQLVCMVLVFVMCLGSISAMHVRVYGSVFATNENMVLIAENARFQMYVDMTTTAVYVRNRATGKLWGTNPLPEVIDAAPGGAFARQELSSQIEMQFFNARGRAITINNFDESIQREQFTITPIPGGVEVFYQIGRPYPLMLAPVVMYVELFEYLLSNLSEGDQDAIRHHYNLLTYESLTTRVRAQRLETYPTLPYQDLMVGNFRGGTTFSDRVQQELHYLFRVTGLTAEQLISHYQQLQFEFEEDIMPLFNIPITYTLTENGLRATIEMDNIVYDEANFRLHTLDFLKFFGAAAHGADGYIFVPDGSGGIIDLQTDSRFSFETGLFGIDNTYRYVSFPGFVQQAVLPVFGLRNGDDAFLAIIEEGAASATIRAVPAEGNVMRTSHVHAGFVIRDLESIDMSARTTGTHAVRSFAAERTGSDISLYFLLLDGENANYSGMARAYRDIIFANRLPIRYRNPQASEDIPFFIDSIGAINRQVRVLGFPVRRNVAVTSYTQAAHIVETFNAAGIDHVVFRYQGWSNGGFNNSYFSRSIRFISALGGRRGFSEMQERMDNNSARFFPDMDFWYAHRLRTGSGFSRMNDMARHLVGFNAFRHEFWLDTLTSDGRLRQFILSPTFVVGFVQRFVSNLLDLGVSGISVASLGSDVNSDFRTDRLVTRPEAANNVTDAFRHISAEGLNVASSYGNAFVLPYVDVLFDVPMTDSGFNSVTRRVPFLQIVLSGYVEFTSGPINLSQDSETYLLRAAEMGAGIRYTLNYSHDTIFQNTEITNMFSTHYATWVEAATQQYERLNNVLRYVRFQRIHEHNRLATRIYETVYECGGRVVVNYTTYDFSLPGTGITVPARDFIFIPGH